MSERLRLAITILMAVCAGARPALAATSSPPATPAARATPAIVTVAPAPPDSATRAALRTMCEYGITLVHSGEEARAESVFIALLSRSSGDPRALNNLGNLSLMRGEVDVARVFYDSALEADTADAGIHLNRATVYLALGEQEKAEDEAALGVRLAGGPKEAAALMGLRDAAGEPKASELSARVQLSWSAGKPRPRTAVTEDEIRSLLGAGRAPDPAVARAESASTKSTTGSAPAPPRSARTKASDATSAATMLYWKR